jgi:hypothetical protein
MLLEVVKTYRQHDVASSVMLDLSQGMVNQRA